MAATGPDYSVSVAGRHLHRAGQTFQFDRFLGLVERRPLLAVDGDTLDRRGLGVAEAQLDRRRRQTRFSASSSSPYLLRNQSRYAAVV